MPKPPSRIPVVVDTREQDPLPLAPERFEVISYKLPTGDISFPGMESTFCIERKSTGDLVSTVIHDWLRFRKELNRMSCMDLAIMLIECDASDIWDKRYESDASPESVFGRLDAVVLDHGVQVILAGRRPYSTRYLERLLPQTWLKLGGNL